MSFVIDRLESEVKMLDRHVDVLRHVVESEPIGIAKIADKTGYSHSEVRYSLRTLEDEGLIEPTSEGAVTTEETGSFIESIDEQVNDFIDRLQSPLEAGTTTIDESEPTTNSNETRIYNPDE